MTHHVYFISQKNDTFSGRLTVINKEVIMIMASDDIIETAILLTSKSISIYTS